MQDEIKVIKSIDKSLRWVGHQSRTHGNIEPLLWRENHSDILIRHHHTIIPFKAILTVFCNLLFSFKWARGGWALNSKWVCVWPLGWTRGGGGGTGLDITATITITMDYAALIIYSTMNPDRTTANQQQLFWRGPDTQMTCSRDGEHEGGDSYFYEEIIMGLVSTDS